MSLDPPIRAGRMARRRCLGRFPVGLRPPQAACTRPVRFAFPCLAQAPGLRCGTGTRPRRADRPPGDHAARWIQAWGEPVERFYRERSFASRVGFGRRPALLVIDMAVAFNDPAYRLGADQTAAVEAIALLLAACRRSRVPVFYLTSAFLPGGRDAGIRLRKIPALAELELGSPAVEIDPRLAPGEGEAVMTKKAPSAFFGTNLSALLVVEGVDTILVTGCSTSGCIRATACDGACHGFRVIVPEECVSDRAPEPYRANLFDIDAKYGDVVSLAEALAYVERLAL